MIFSLKKTLLSFCFILIGFKVLKFLTLCNLKGKVWKKLVSAAYYYEVKNIFENSLIGAYKNRNKVKYVKVNLFYVYEISLTLFYKLKNKTTVKKLLTLSNYIYLK